MKEHTLNRSLVARVENHSRFRFVDDANNYQPISLLCVPLKLLERLRLTRLDPVIDPQLPPEQAGFRHGRSTTDQVTLLTDDIEAGFEQNQQVGVALVDLTAAYDTVWLRGLNLKLLRMLPDRHMVSFVMKLLTDRSLTLRTSDGQVSRLRRIHNGVPQGSTLAPTLLYINHIGPRGSHDTKVASAFRSYATGVASATPLWRDKRIGLSLYRPVRAN